MNGRFQDYHGANVLGSGIKSPLLDLVGARYIIIPAHTDPERKDMIWLREHFPEVYRDDQVVILENRDAMPRAWLVHEAREVAPDESSDVLAGGTVDFRTTAIVETKPPALEPPPPGATEQVTVLEASPEGLTMRVRTSAPALLVVNVTGYPTWHATVDGEASKIYAANHFQTAIAVPAGEHVVEMTHRSRMLSAGIGITAATAGGLLGAILVGSVLAAIRRRAPPHARRRRWAWALPGD